MLFEAFDPFFHIGDALFGVRRHFIDGERAERESCEAYGAGNGGGNGNVFPFHGDLPFSESGGLLEFGDRAVLVEFRASGLEREVKDVKRTDARQAPQLVPPAVFRIVEPAREYGKVGKECRQSDDWGKDVCRE